ncbi:MAG: GFA family protein [Sphingomicrobium sp.]
MKRAASRFGGDQACNNSSSAALNANSSRSNAMAEQTYHGGCHCGAVRYSAEIDLDQGSIRCNCSLCSKSRAWLAFTSAEKFRLEMGKHSMLTYRWTPQGKTEPNLSYHICSTCGVRTHADGMAPTGKRTVAVQVATIEDADPNALANGIHYVDGLHDHFDRQPEDLRLL